jgi:hypothetical protein
MPMVRYVDEIKRFHPYFFVTITPYGRDVEPRVPDKYAVMDAVKKLSEQLSRQNVCWRYDPIFITEKYNIDYHIRAFEKIASQIGGYIDECVISFVDLYAKTRRNFPTLRAVTKEEKAILAQAISQISKKYGFSVKSCAENGDLIKYGIKQGSCMSRETLEKAVGNPLMEVKNNNAREYCSCLPSRDIGDYNACMHGCLYCYANYDMKIVADNFKLHDPHSPLVLGHVREGDVITEAVQRSFVKRQMEIEF